MLKELLEILVSLLPARNRSLGSEMRRYRQQQQKRRRMLSDTEREELIARWTARTRPGERPAKLIAGRDFTHCEKGQCKNCSKEQRGKCEREVNERSQDGI